MLLRDKINADIATAMKSKIPARLSALRMLKAAIMNKGIEKSHDLDDAEVLQVVSTLVKQRRDSIDQFSKAGRTDLVDKETAEIAMHASMTGHLVLSTIHTNDAASAVNRRRRPSTRGPAPRSWRSGSSRLRRRTSGRRPIPAAA